MHRLGKYLAPQLLHTITLRKLALRYRLAGALMLLSLLPLAVSSVIGYKESTAAVRQTSGTLATEVVKQVARHIGLEMARLEADSEALVLSDRIQNALFDYAAPDEARRTASHRELTHALLEHYGSVDFLNQKYLLDRDNRIIDGQVFATLGEKVVQFARRAPKLLGRPFWGTYDNAAGQKSMVLLRAIHNKPSSQHVGSLFLGVRPSHFAALFDDVRLGGGSALFVFDADAGTVAVDAFNSTGTAAAAVPAAALAAELRRSLHRNVRSGFVGYSGAGGDGGDGNAVAAYAQVADTSWFVVGTIPMGALAGAAKSVRDQNILIGLAALLVSSALGLILARSIARPLASLARAMGALDSGSYASRVTPAGSDELAALAHRFNDMAGRIEQDRMRLEGCLDQRSGELAEANARLAAQSVTDGLTGIANRRRFDEVLAGELARAARAGAPLALLLLDVDFFKQYNEAYGHQQGDDCLRRIGGLLQSHARRASDLAARFGGARFVLIAYDTDNAGALALGEAIRASLESLQLAHARSPLGRVTASIGAVSVVPGETSSIAELLRTADGAMARAKEAGRNRVAGIPTPADAAGESAHFAAARTVYIASPPAARAPLT